MSNYKKYVLLESQLPTAPISILTDKKTRVRLKGMPNAAPYLKVGVVTESGDNKIMRLKLTSKYIYQDEQMKEESIPANEKFTNAEREAVKFRNGELITTNKQVMKFLDNHPQNKNFKGQSIEQLAPMFEERNEQEVAKNELSEHRLRLKAANRIDKMSFEEATEMLILINGSFYKAPDSVEDAQLDLIDLMETKGQEVIDLILREEKTPDEGVNILIGKLVNLGQVSFDAVPNKVVLKDGDKWIPLKDVPTEYSLEDSQRVLVAYLTSEEGKPLLEDLELRLSTIESAAKETEKTKAQNKKQ